MATVGIAEVERRIEEFKKRMETELEYCKELFRHAGTRLLCHKYAYYEKGCAFIDDYAYDGEETSWFIMGRALGVLTEDDTSPCIDFDYNHPLANDGIALYHTLVPKTYLKDKDE